MKVVALLEVDDEILKDYDSFETEMGWVAQSGITLTDYYVPTSKKQVIEVVDNGLEVKAI